MTKPDVKKAPGHWLRAARTLWFAVVLLTLFVFIASVPARFHQLLTTPLQLGSSTFGQHFSPLLQAIYFLTCEIITMAVFSAVGFVIFWLKSDDGMALFASLTLITLGADLSATIYKLGLQPAWRLQAAAFIHAINSASFLSFFYLFPNGRFVPRWTRWLAVAWAGWYLIKLLFPTASFLEPLTWPPILWFLWGLGWYGTGVFAQLYRYFRTSGTTERQQTKWVVLGVMIISLAMAAYFLPFVIFPSLPHNPSAYSLYTLITAPLVTLFVSALPVTIGFSLCRYRLWDVDPVLSRTLVYATLTSMVIGLYTVVVGVLGKLFQVSNNLLISLFTTGLIAVCFHPVRERLQRGVNRLMYGERDDPYTVLSRLGQRLEATISPESVLPTIVETVAQALKLPYAAIVLEEHGRRSIADNTSSVSLQTLPSRHNLVVAYGQPTPDSISFPLMYQGEMLGQLILAPRAPGEVFSPADQRLLDDFLRHAGVAVHAVLLTQALQRSRAQLVTAREEERRRLRRDLHDGLGPTLASMTFKVDMATNALTDDPTTASARALLQQLQTQIQTTLEDIRRLVYDLRPPTLDHLGLVVALREEANRRNGASGLRVSVEASPLPVLPAAVEVAAYRIAMEAFVNVIRHARARTCQIRFTASQMLEIEIVDDGEGLPTTVRTGVGLTSMQERATELGGTCLIESSPKKGTRILARLPLSE